MQSSSAPYIPIKNTTTGLVSLATFRPGWSAALKSDIWTAFPDQSLLWSFYREQTQSACTSIRTNRMFSFLPLCWESCCGNTCDLYQFSHVMSLSIHGANFSWRTINSLWLTSLNAMNHVCQRCFSPFKKRWEHVGRTRSADDTYWA